VKEKRSGKKLFFMVGVCLMLLILVVPGMASCTGSTPAPTSAATTQPAAATTAIQPIKLVYSSNEPPMSWLATDVMMPWIADLEKAAGGAIKIEPHWGGELAESNEAYDAVVNGIADMGDPKPTELPTRFPLTGVLTMNSYDVACYKRSLVYRELYQKYPEMQAEYKDTKVLWLYDQTYGAFATTNKPLRTLADCQGVKMLGVGEWIAAREKALGMIPVSMAPMDMMPALQKGVLDGSTIAPFLLRDFQMGAFLKYVTDVSCSMTPWAFVMNLKTWDKIPANVQKSIEGVSMEWQNKIDGLYLKMTADRLGSAPKEFGIEVINLSAEEKAKWAAVDTPVRNDFVKSLNAKGLPAQKVMDDFLALEKKYAASEYAPK
jgi:TRAP-type C4-dicarboxylate transport system substrate-binding protein